MSASKHTPEPWLREGTTVYALMHAGWSKGTETVKNRFTVHVSADPEVPVEELEAIVALIQSAPVLARRVQELEAQVALLKEENQQVNDCEAIHLDQIAALEKRTQELEDQIEREIMGQVQISESAGRAHDKARARIAALEEENARLLAVLGQIRTVAAASREDFSEDKAGFQLASLLADLAFLVPLANSAAEA